METSNPFSPPNAIDLPIARYLHASWGIVGCCLGGYLAGLAVKQLLGGQTDGVRMLIVSATAMTVIGLLLAFWQKITPRSIGRALKG